MFLFLLITASLFEYFNQHQHTAERTCS